MKHHVLHIIQYFGIFRHPLKTEEAWRFLGTRASLDEVSRCVAELVAEGSLVSCNGYLHIPGTGDWTALRMEREQRAFAMLKKAPVYTRIIASFPFVRSIAVSGSLSKLSAMPNADIDYFIVTARNRLWITRTLLHLFKKLTFLVGKQHSFCMNYFVDEAGLELAYQNEFTAIELATLIPFYEERWIKELREANPWARKLLPNHDMVPFITPACLRSRFLLKPLLEALFDLAAPQRLNRWLMQLTDWKWRRKFASLGLREEDYQRAFYTTVHASKNHRYDYQKKVLTALREDTYTFAA